MPLPIWFIGMAAGAIGHMSAQKKQETAERLNREAKDLYDISKSDLDKAVSSARSSISELQWTKRYTLGNSISLFLKSYEKIKNIQFRKTEGISELDKFQVTYADMPKLQEFTDIYGSALSSSAAGAAVGAAALAVGSAETAVALGATVTPLAAIAAPVVVFTAIGALAEADENLSKAKKTYAEAEKAAEKMRTEIVKCNAIKERVGIFLDLLNQLNERFYYCAFLLNELVNKKSQNGNIKLKAEDFTEDEIKLIAVTRALAGAVKAVIDVPVLGSDGKPTSESKNKSVEIKNALPIFQQQVSEVEHSSAGMTQEEFKARLAEMRRIEAERRAEAQRLQQQKEQKQMRVKTGVAIVGSLLIPVPPVLKCLIFCIIYSFICDPEIVSLADGTIWLLTFSLYVADIAETSHPFLKALGALIAIIVIFIYSLVKEAKGDVKMDSKNWSNACTINAIYAGACPIGLIIYLIMKFVFGKGTALGIVFILYIIVIFLTNSLLIEGYMKNNLKKLRLKALGLAFLVLIADCIVYALFV